MSKRSKRPGTPSRREKRPEGPSSPPFQFWTARLSWWSRLYSQLAIATVVVVCLVPFSNKAFHVDDTLFVRAAQQIVKHPFDPYGFHINWDGVDASMADVTQNPPLASYYAALIASGFGWSERALHLGFIIIAIALGIGTYRLAENFTRAPLLVALLTVLSPGVIVSASSLMCDTMMLALWVWAAYFWLRGVKQQKAFFLAAASVAIAAAALTKYFGVSLIPLLLVYTLVYRRRLTRELLWLLIPVVVLAGYQYWTANLYGQGLLLGAATYAANQRAVTTGSLTASLFVGLSFAGGCSLFAAFLAPFVWSRGKLILAVLASAAASVALIAGWFNLGLQFGREAEQAKVLPGIQSAIFIMAGIVILGLGLNAIRTKLEPDSLFLVLWLFGTFVFAAFLNYTVNARSVLPLIPTAAILLVRRLDRAGVLNNLNSTITLVILLVVMTASSLWATAGDSALANAAREAAKRSIEKTKGTQVWFQGHWGFQYYMEALGAQPVDFSRPAFNPGDFVVVPSNNIQISDIPGHPVVLVDTIEFPMTTRATTIACQLRAGFYSYYWGPLPYAFGKVPAEKYFVVRIGSQ